MAFDNAGKEREESEQTKKVQLETKICDIYRYYTNNYNDYAWGCVYRNVQTILSSLNGHLSTKKDQMNDNVDAVTTITISKMPEFVSQVTNNAITFNPNSNEKFKSRDLWIEPHDAYCYFKKYYSKYIESKMYLFFPNNTWINKQCQNNNNDNNNNNNNQTLDNLLIKQTVGKKFGNNNKFENVKYELVTNLSKMREMIVNHFKLRNSLPILIDDASYSYIIAGIRYNGDNFNHLEYRIIDPHYIMAFPKGKDVIKPKYEPLKDKYGIVEITNGVKDDDSEMDEWKHCDWFEKKSEQYSWMMLFPTCVNKL